MPFVNHKENLGDVAVCVGVATGWATDISAKQTASKPTITIMFTVAFSLPPPNFLSAIVVLPNRINNAKTIVSHGNSGISGVGDAVGGGVAVESVVDGVAVGVDVVDVVVVGVGLVIVGSAVGVDCGVAVGVAVGVGVGVTVDGLYVPSTWIRWSLVVAASTLGTAMIIIRMVIMSKSLSRTAFTR